MAAMVRWMTAGESHGSALVGILEGLPAGVQITSADVQHALARRRLGYGRGARMKFEEDHVRIIGGVRHGVTFGAPIAIEVGNTEWPKWEQVMSPDPVDPEVLDGLARADALTRPRPGHADLAGMTKYQLSDARPILERASARETAARVALGAVAQHYLRQVAGIEILSHTVAIGDVTVPEDTRLNTFEDRAALDADPVRCIDPTTSAAMVALIDDTKKAGDTLGGVVEVVAFGVPVGLGSHVHWDRRLDAQLAAALMGIQAIKAVEVGDGLQTARRPGSIAHDEIHQQTDDTSLPAFTRHTDRAGGIEGGMTIGGSIRVRAAMKPISTVPRALGTVDISTGEPAAAINQRSDVCAVPAAGIVAEAMVALVLADALQRKVGGDHVDEAARNLAAYLAAIPASYRVGSR